MTNQNIMNKKGHSTDHQIIRENTQEAFLFKLPVRERLFRVGEIQADPG